MKTARDTLRHSEDGEEEEEDEVHRLKTRNPQFLFDFKVFGLFGISTMTATLWTTPQSCFFVEKNDNIQKNTLFFLENRPSFFKKYRMRNTETFQNYKN